MNRAEGTGRDAQPAIVATLDVEVGQLVEVNADDGADFANISRQTAVNESGRSQGGVGCESRAPQSAYSVFRARSGAGGFHQRRVRFEVFYKHLAHQVTGFDDLWIAQPIMDVQSLASRDDDSLLAH